MKRIEITSFLPFMAFDSDWFNALFNSWDFICDDQSSQDLSPAAVVANVFPIESTSLPPLSNQEVVLTGSSGQQQRQQNMQQVQSQEKIERISLIKLEGR
jgi:heme exporter protein D